MPREQLATLGLAVDERGFISGVDKATGAVKRLIGIQRDLNSTLDTTKRAFSIATPLILSFAGAIASIQFSISTYQAIQFSRAIGEVSTANRTASRPSIYSCGECAAPRS